MKSTVNAWGCLFVHEEDIADAEAAPPCMGVSFETCKIAREKRRNGVSLDDLTRPEYESLLFYHGEYECDGT